MTEQLLPSDTLTVKRNFKMKVVKDNRKKGRKDSTRKRCRKDSTKEKVDKDFHIDAALLAEARAAVTPAAGGRKKLPRKNPELNEFEPNENGNFDWKF